MSRIVTNVTTSNMTVNPYLVRDDSLILLLDAENPKSNVGDNKWIDLSDYGNSATIYGATVTNDHISFDGSNDYLGFASNFSMEVHNGFTFWVVWDLPAQTSGAWNYFLFHDPAGSHKYEFGNYGTLADRFHYKDNISFAGTAATDDMASSGYSSYAFGTTSNGRTYTSVNGHAATIKDPGSNSYWATTPTTPMVFNQLFRGSTSFFGAKVKMLCLYKRQLTDAEIAQNNLVANRRKRV